MSKSTVHLDTELRKLRPAELYTLGQILNISDSWKKLMAIVPKEEASDTPKFKAEHFSMIEQAAQQQGRNAAEIFLAEWGTMGKYRPTLCTLLNLLVKAELFRAADYIAGDILKEELPKRPEYGPAAPIDISDKVIRKLLEEKAELQDIDFNESLIFGLPSEVNDNKVMYNATHSSSLERNMQSTKLISIKNIQQNYEKTSSNVEMSDLMKFSCEHNTEQYKTQNNLCTLKQPTYTQKTKNNYFQEYDFKKQEMLSCELPVFLNKFGQSMEEMKLNQEVLSDQLPVFLNNSMVVSNNSLHNNPINDSLHLSDLNINQNEMTSTELPQCILELSINSASDSHNTAVTSNGESIIQNALNSQELPVTVLEYIE